MKIKSFLLVLIFALTLAMWAQDRPLFADGGYWLLVSLVLYLSIMPLVPLIFLPRGRVSRPHSPMPGNEGRSRRISRPRSATPRWHSRERTKPRSWGWSLP